MMALLVCGESVTYENIVMSVDWSPDGRFLASVSADGMVRVWEIDLTGNE